MSTGDELTDTRTIRRNRRWGRSGAERGHWQDVVHSAGRTDGKDL
jgi:hypothetical protein